MKNKAYFTTSWDDGSIYDVKLAELLAKYQVKGTFYIPIRNCEGIDILSSSQIREISKQFEIGVHTYSHKVLTKLPDEVAKKEIVDGKNAVEDITQKKTYAFCFPKGKYFKKHLQMIKDVGFLFGRTCGFIRIRNSTDKKGIMYPTLQMFPHKTIVYWISSFKRKDLESSLHLIRNIHILSNHDLFLRSLLNYAELVGGVFHLWGHSWEIERYNLWNNLEIFLKSVYDRNFTFYTNTELWKFMRS